MKFLPWLIFTVAAVLEVGGDALVRRGVRGGGAVFIVAGFLVLGCYGLVVNSMNWDFSRLLGVYVAFFAVVSILCGHYFFRETIPVYTWVGLGLIVLGGLIIQFGRG